MFFIDCKGTCIYFPLSPSHLAELQQMPPLCTLGPYSTTMVPNHSKLLTAQKIKDLVDDGQLIVIHEGYALKLDGWLNKHPGGHLAILHMVGRDATDEINA